MLDKLERLPADTILGLAAACRADPNPAKVVEDIKGGKIEFRVDKHANVHFVVGKASFSADQLDENLKAALEEIARLKPSSSKGRYIQKGAVSTTFGPGIPLDVNTLV